MSENENVLNNDIKQVVFEVKPGTAYDSTLKYLAQRDQDQVNLEYAAMMNSRKEDNNPIMADIIDKLNKVNNYDKPYRYALVSGGKDSVTMVEVIMKNYETYPCDAVVFIDTQCEFPVMYRNAVRCLKRFEAWGQENDHKVEVMILYPKLGWWDILESGYGRSNNSTQKNVSIPNNRLLCRRVLRTDVVSNFHKILAKKGYTRIEQYIGRTPSDGRKSDFARSWSKGSKKTNLPVEMIYPLIDCDSDEKQNLLISARAGYDYEGFYDDFDHGYCFACPQRPLRHWRILWHKYPGIWEFMRKKFSLFPHITVVSKTGYTFTDLERRFMFEVEYVKKHPEVNYNQLIQVNHPNKHFTIALYLTLGTYNPYWQQKANELLVKKKETYTTNFFEDDSSPDEIPIVVYNIIDGKETYYNDVKEFAKRINILPTEVREYCDRSVQPEYTNSERLLRGVFLCRYTWGKEYIPYDGPVIPMLSLYGWVLDEETQNTKKELMKDLDVDSIQKIDVAQTTNDLPYHKSEAIRDIFLEERAKIIDKMDEEQKARMDTIADLENAPNIAYDQVSGRNAKVEDNYWHQYARNNGAI